MNIPYNRIKRYIYVAASCECDSVVNINTWSELKIVKSHAKIVELVFIVRIPNTQVSPRRGKSTIEATNKALHILMDIILLLTIISHHARYWYNYAQNAERLYYMYRSCIVCII